MMCEINSQTIKQHQVTYTRTRCYFIVWLLISDIISSLPKQLFTQYMKVSTRSFKHCVPFRHAGGYIEIMVMHVGYMRCLHFPMTSLLLTISLYKFNIIPFLMGSGVITLNYGRIPVDLVQPETSPSLSFFGTQRKPFIYRRNRTNSR